MSDWPDCNLQQSVQFVWSSSFCKYQSYTNHTTQRGPTLREIPASCCESHWCKFPAKIIDTWQRKAAEVQTVREAIGKSYSAIHNLILLLREIAHSVQDSPLSETLTHIMAGPDTTAIRVGDISLVLPSNARLPNVHVRPDGIELDFMSFTGKLLVQVPDVHLKSPSYLSRAESAVQSHGSGTPSNNFSPQRTASGTPAFARIASPKFSTPIRHSPCKRLLGSTHLPSPAKINHSYDSFLADPEESMRGYMERYTSSSIASPTPPPPIDEAQRDKTMAELHDGIRNGSDSSTVDRSSQAQEQQNEEEQIENEANEQDHSVDEPSDEHPGNTREDNSDIEGAKHEENDTETAPEIPSSLAEECSNGLQSNDVPKRKRSTNLDVSDDESYIDAVSNSVRDGKRVRFLNSQSQSQSFPMSPGTPGPRMGTNPWMSISVSEEDSSMPDRRWGATLTRIDEESALLVGGESESHGFFEDMTHLDIRERVWTRSRDTPDIIGGGRAWHTTTLIDTCLVVFGGEVNRKNTRTQTNDVVFYDTGFFSWYTPQLTGTAPTPRAGHCAALLPGTKDLVVFGGIHGSRWLSDVHRLSDLASWTKVRISQKSARPAARSYASLTTLKDFVVLFGGNNKTRCFNDVHLLNPKDMTWMFPLVSGRAPKPRTGHSAIATEDGSSIIIYGGWDDQGVQRIFYSDVWELKVNSHTDCSWRCIYTGDNSSKSPGPRAGAALCAAIGTKAYLFGGWHQIAYFNDVIELSLES